jgi:Kef-type K+ transport system membrane component KefB
MDSFILNVTKLAAIIIFAKLSEVFAKRSGLPPVSIQLLAGILLGPSVLSLTGTPVLVGTWGSVSQTPAHSILKVLAEAGLIQLMFLSGLNIDWSALKESWSGTSPGSSAEAYGSGPLPAWRMSCLYLIPALSAAGVGFWGTHRAGGALAIGGIMAAAGLGVAFQTLKEQDLRQCAATNKILGHAVLSTLLGVFLLIAGQATEYAKSYGVLRMAVAVSWLMGKLVMFFAVAYFLMSRYLNRVGRTGSEKWSRQALFGYLLLVAAIYAWGAMHFGSFAAVIVSGFGGALLGIYSRDLKEKLSRTLSSPVAGIFTGVLFIVLGMEAQLQEVWNEIAFGILLLIGAIGGKAIGLWIVPRKEFGSPGERALQLWGILPPAEMGMILAAYAFSRGLLAPSEFQVVIASVLTLTVLGPLAIKIGISLKKCGNIAALVLVLVLPWMIPGCGNRREAQPPEQRAKDEGRNIEVSKKAENPVEAKQAADIETAVRTKRTEPAQPGGKAEKTAPGAVQITPERHQLTGAKSGAAEIKPREKVIRTVGRVDYDEKRIITVTPKLNGRIEDVYIDDTGTYVRQGEPVLSIYSPEMVAAQEEYLLALRAKDEFSKSPFSEVAGSGESLAESAKRRLKLWGIGDEQIRTLEETRQSQKTLNLYAPRGGYVMGNQAYKGMNVTPETPLFKLADLSVVRVISDIDEHDLSFVRTGQRAAVKLDSFPVETFTAKAIDVDGSLNPKTRTPKVAFEISNPKGKLKPEMNAVVEIKINLGPEMVISRGPITASRDVSEPGTPPSVLTFPDQTVYDTLISQLSRKHKVDSRLIKAIIRAESGFNPYAISKKGARGLMQLMPATAQRMNVSNVFDPKDNIEGGIRYLKYLNSQFRNDLPLSLAAYSAGENVVAQFKGMPPYRETVDYVRKVMIFYHSYKS